MAFALLNKMLRRSPRALACAVAALTVATVGVSPSASAEELILTVHKVTAIDQIDGVSPADFFARVVIDGNIHLTPVIKQRNDIEPNWQINQKVKGRQIKVFLELWDKDLTKDELIDINPRTDINKRPIDFTVDMRTCRIKGLKGSPKCGTEITYEGNEKKKAKIVFSVRKGEPKGKKK
jgi:hypothetical protein